MVEQDAMETIRGITRKIASLTTSELKRLRDSSFDWQEWCLYNACMHIREALSKNDLQDLEMWEHIAMELAKNQRPDILNSEMEKHKKNTITEGEQS